MPARFYKPPSGYLWVTDPVDYGADPTGVSSSITAINAAINATRPGGECVLPAGRFLCTQTSPDLTDVVRLKPGVTLRGQGAGITTLVGTAAASPVIVAVRAPQSAVKDMTILHGGYRAGLTFPAAEGWRYGTGTSYDYGTKKYTGWDRYYEALFTSTGMYGVPRDHDSIVFIGSSVGVTVSGVTFDSEWDDERGWIWTCVYCLANEESLKGNGVTVTGCTFKKARFGLLTPGYDNIVFSGNTHTTTWSYAGAPPGHMIYVTGSPTNYTSTEFTLCVNCTVTDNVDVRTWLPTTYAAAQDYFGDVSIKIRKVDGLTMSGNICVSEQAGFGLYDIKSGTMTGDYYDASSCPESGTMTWGASGSFPFFAVDNTHTPATGYTTDNFILGPMNFTGVTIITPYQPVGDSGWITWVLLNAYTNGTPKKAASVADVWSDVVVYMAPKPSAATNTWGMSLVGKDGTYGSVGHEVRFFPHPTAVTWASDQEFFRTSSVIGTQNTTNAMRVAVEAPTGSFPVSHPPLAHAGQSGSSNTFNGAAFEFPTDVTFSNTTTTNPNPVPDVPTES